MYHFNAPFELLVKYYVVSPKRAGDLKNVFEQIEHVFVESYHFNKASGALHLGECT